MTKTESRSTTPLSVTTTSGEKREEIDNPFDYGHPSDYFGKAVLASEVQVDELTMPPQSPSDDTKFDESSQYVGNNV
ncbi:hypothetical protein DICVIV_13799 [Dictyocaulus viviparus]|uniref:Uncharacterized protein n=1 Tax=Dictyocaulus viviparus TaxID=29172 RepID=A0A0D8X9F7_DICVI|nr:hypothetical protein DICVIV_13799 [Dictyocaulus viviparus]